MLLYLGEPLNCSDSAEAICRYLWETQRFRLHETLESWLVANAKVWANLFCQPVRYDTPENHVADLKRLRILVKKL